jgi:anti-sigma B factor antagonist
METTGPLDISRHDGVAIARFTSVSITDVEEIARASAQLRTYIETHRPDALVFDFTGVKFFSSQVLGVLLEARTRLQPSQGRIVVVGLSAQLSRVFRITNLDTIFELYPDLPAALAHSPTPPN